MGYRGSKSKFYYKENPQSINNLNFVKEQRVDGSWLFASFCAKQYKRKNNLRCILMGLEKDLHIKNHSNQLNKLFFSTFLSKDLKKLNPWFVTGFCDAESNFTCSIVKDSRSNMKWEVSMSFNISLHMKDIKLLEDIKYTP
jgi:hypothetical protein